MIKLLIPTTVLLLCISCVSLPEKARVIEDLARYMPAEQLVYCFIDLQEHKELSKDFVHAVGIGLKDRAFDYLLRLFASSGDEGAMILVEHKVPPFAMRGELKKGGFQKLSKTEFYHPESGFRAYFREDYLLEISQGDFERGVDPAILAELQEHTFSLQLFGELPGTMAIPLVQNSFLEKIRIFRDTQDTLQFKIELTDDRGSRAFVKTATLLFSGGISLGLLGSEYAFRVSSLADNELLLASDEVSDAKLIGVVAEIFETWLNTQ